MSLQRGRPSKAVQLQIVKDIRPYFEKSYSATFTAGKTGHDVKTVCNYFNEWSRQLVQDESKDFIQRQRESMENTIIHLDQIIFEEYNLLEDVNEEIKKSQKNGRPIPKHLITTKFNILKEISNITQHRLSLLMTPTMDVDIDIMVKKRLGELGIKFRHNQDLSS